MRNHRGWRIGAIRHDLAAIRKHSERVKSTSLRLEKDLDEAYDAGLLSLRSNTGGGIPPKGTVSRLTEASSGSYEFKRIQSVNQHVANKVSKAEKAVSSAEKALDDAIQALWDAWMDTDPDDGPDRRARRAAAIAES